MAFLTAAAASIVYLTCSLDTGKRVEQIQLAIDEPNQRVTMSWPKYKNISVRDQALFDAGSVTVQGQYATTRVDRTSLAIERTNLIPFGKGKVDRGICQFAEAETDRKF